MNEHLADRTPSPTFSTSDSEITELADERQSEMEDFMDDEAFVDDTSSDAGTEEGSDIFSDGQDPFYDRSPWFILVGRLVVATAEKPEKWGLERMNDKEKWRLLCGSVCSCWWSKDNLETVKMNTFSIHVRSDHQNGSHGYTRFLLQFSTAYM